MTVKTWCTLLRQPAFLHRRYELALLEFDLVGLDRLQMPNRENSGEEDTVASEWMGKLFGSGRQLGVGVSSSEGYRLAMWSVSRIH